MADYDVDPAFEERLERVLRTFSDEGVGRRDVLETTQMAIRRVAGPLPESRPRRTDRPAWAVPLLVFLVAIGGLVLLGIAGELGRLSAGVLVTSPSPPGASLPGTPPASVPGVVATVSPSPTLSAGPTRRPRPTRQRNSPPLTAGPTEAPPVTTAPVATEFPEPPESVLPPTDPPTDAPPTQQPTAEPTVDATPEKPAATEATPDT